jgi:hypothetical protein
MGSPAAAKREELIREFARVINYHSLEQKSNTPDYILAEYLVTCLFAFDMANVRKALHEYGQDPGADTDA